MKIIKDNDELKTYIKDGMINIQDDLQCGFNIEVKASIICWNLDCWNLDCGNLICWNLDCCNIDCGNLTCGNLDCLKVNCGDLDYYVFAIARRTFKCKSAKGSITNSFHKCLDSEIEYIKEPVKQEMTIAEIEKALGKSIKIVKEESLIINEPNTRLGAKEPNQILDIKPKEKKGLIFGGTQLCKHSVVEYFCNKCTPKEGE